MLANNCLVIKLRSSVLWARWSCDAEVEDCSCGCCGREETVAGHDACCTWSL